LATGTRFVPDQKLVVRLNDRLRENREDNETIVE
jgi:hypothetical protein